MEYVYLYYLGFKRTSDPHIMVSPFYKQRTSHNITQFRCFIVTFNKVLAAVSHLEICTSKIKKFGAPLRGLTTGNMGEIPMNILDYELRKEYLF